MERISAMNIIIYGCKMAKRHIHVDIGILLAANRQVITKWQKFPRFDAEILFESSIRSVFRFMDSIAHKYWIYQNFDDILVSEIQWMWWKAHYKPNWSKWNHWQCAKQKAWNQYKRNKQHDIENRLPNFFVFIFGGKSKSIIDDDIIIKCSAKSREKITLRVSIVCAVDLTRMLISAPKA